MSYTPLQSLIDKQDGFEIVRDQVAAILAAETLNQQALAALDAKDPEPWKLRVFLERDNPWEQFLNIEEEDATTDLSPIVNVWVDSMNYDMSKGNVVERQTSNTTINIDIYGVGVSEADGSGHIPGDKAANLEVQRAFRLVRNIIMSASNVYLQIPGGVVGRRWPQSVSLFQPPQDANNVQKVVGARFALDVQHNEFSPQYEAVPLEILANEITLAESGQVILANYDFTS